MSPIDPKAVLNRVKEEGFENVWRESAGLLPKPKSKEKPVPKGKGTPHPFYSLVQKLRTAFLDLGFKEVYNPIIVDENEVYKQYGPEASIILDRCYYLAALPRPDIGLSKAKQEELENAGVKLTDAKIASLQKVLRDYKKGDVDSDDIVEKMAEALEAPDTIAMRAISDVFPEFSALRPEASRLTLRSHMTTAWFLTLQALRSVSELPVRLFSVDVRFRREQREDQTHLRVHHAASCVVMDESVDVKDGEKITRALLEPLGFKKFRFIKKKVTSKYYAPGMEYEGFILNSASNKWVEAVDYGIYSPIALARYDLEHPVLNVGIGVERIAMLIHGEEDLRRLIYPQFYAELELSDAEIARTIGFEAEPRTGKGRELAKNILSTALKHADEDGPCEFLAYKDNLLGRNVQVYVYENEKKVKLLGAAAKNCVYVYNGNIVGAPLEGMDDVKMVKLAREKGICTGIRYVDGIAALAAAQIEEAARNGRVNYNLRVRLARRPSDINIKVGEVARRYIMNKKRKISISGPVFIGIRAEISD
jgi:O-phosphoseryl-tRNA synthetase